MGTVPDAFATPAAAVADGASTRPAADVPGQMLSQRVEQLARRYPDDVGRVIGLLNDVQDECGYLPEEALRAIADLCDVPYEELVASARFFKTLSTEPVGKVVIEVCDGTACHTQGAVRLAQAIADKLGIEVGQTTPDGLFTLRLVHCVGACSVAPVAVVAGTAYGRVKTANADGVIEHARVALEEAGRCGE
ncbi:MULTISPECIES: NAD(P)H-dependent oxidoreductase subunit E [unclassified Adlercreutzia]|uniref:NADH-quinone oxidoreductase subunit NuoE family protein n=1 Tax=unclassified Adlercreutzia TaxID=2636013 RepID=UPI0013EDF5FE|nr:MULTISPECIES: NAD(P)H-dependent oxidoreductase subunit E [unclassified Adlercreutzia]